MNENEMNGPLLIYLLDYTFEGVTYLYEFQK